MGIAYVVDGGPLHSAVAPLLHYLKYGDTDLHRVHHSPYDLPYRVVYSIDLGVWTTRVYQFVA